MEWSTILAIALGSLAVLVPVAFVWYICIGGMCIAIKGRRAVSSLTCSIDADCPPGFLCVNGHCVPQKA